MFEKYGLEHASFPVPCNWGFITDVPDFRSNWNLAPPPTAGGDAATPMNTSGGDVNQLQAANDVAAAVAKETPVKKGHGSNAKTTSDKLTWVVFVFELLLFTSVFFKSS